ncbi:MAG: type I-U CRISPR-associated protein Csx17 [Candidatus Paceibacterota bacterium]
MNVIELQGCSPTPLAHYLKAVGVLRLVTEQVDSSARGFWRNERFHLVTSLRKQELESFFLGSYSPTPFMSPWNKGAGFFKADAGIAAIEASTAPRFERFRQGITESRALLKDITQADAIVRAIKAATKTDSSFQTDEQRKLLRSSNVFASLRKTYQDVIDASDSHDDAKTHAQTQCDWLEGLSAPGAQKPTKKAAQRLKAADTYKRLLVAAENQFKTLKAKLIPECRRRWRGRHARWMNAAVVLDFKGEPSWPSLLGTGGNDGNFDFTNNAMQLVVALFDIEHPESPATAESKVQLRVSLWADSAPQLEPGAVGQFSPGTAGGPNAGCGFGGRALVNPWDFLLMLEGAIAFSAGVARRTTTEHLPKAAAPFAVYESAAGFASGVEGEKSRGEQWMPLWKQPLTFRELTSMLGEARCQLGGKPAKRPVEMARAIARLGIARGISEFERYGFIERNGQSNLATPLGRWTVPNSPPPHQELLDQIEDWVDRLRTKAGSKGAPASIGRAARRCENAMMDCCRPGADSADWRELLIRLGDAESQIIRSPAFTGSAGLQPLGAFSRLSAQWLVAAREQSAELRLALALAGAHGTKHEPGKKQPETNPADPVRRHFLPLETRRKNVDHRHKKEVPTEFSVSGERLARDSNVVCTTGDLQRDAIRILRRRLIIATQNGNQFFPLTSVPSTEASLTDILALLAGQVNEAKVLALARPLMALDWRQVDEQRMSIRQALGTPTLQEDSRAADSLGIYGLFRLGHHWRSIETPVNPSNWSYVEHAVRLAPPILTHLTQGNLATATKLAVHRLKVSGLMPHVRIAVGDRQFAARLAMSLVFPISQANVRSLSHRLVRPEIKSEPEEMET